MKENKTLITNYYLNVALKQKFAMTTFTSYKKYFEEDVPKYMWNFNH